MKEKGKMFILIGIIAIVFLLVLVTILFINSENKETITEPGNEVFKPTYELSKDDSIADFMTINNCINKNNDFDNNGEFIARKVYYFNANLNIKTFFVSGYILDDKTKQAEEIKLVINIDYRNQAFKIISSDDTYNIYIDMEDFDNIKIDEKLKEKIVEIKQTDENSIEEVNGLRRKGCNDILL